MRKSTKELIKFSGLYSVANIFQRSLLIFIIPITTHYLTTADFGVFSLLIITGALLQSFSIKPVMTAYSRFYYFPEYKEHRPIFLFNISIFYLICTAFLIFIYLIFSHELNEILFDGKYLDLIYLFSANLFLISISILLFSHMRMIKKAKEYALINLLNFVVSNTVTIILLVMYSLKVEALIYGQMSGLFLAILFSLRYLLKDLIFKFNYNIIKKALKYGFSSVLQSSSTLLLDSGDRYIIRMYLDLASLGVYDFAYKIASLLNTALIQPLKEALMPIVFEMEDDRIKQKKFISDMAIYFYLFSLVCAYALSIFSKEFIQLLASKEEFWESWHIVYLIAFAYVQLGLGNFVSWGLTMKLKVLLITTNIIIAVIINIVLNIILIPIYGIEGAAFATVISYLVWNVLKIIHSNKYYDLKFSTIRISISSILFFVFYYIPIYTFGTMGLLELLAIKLAFMIMLILLYYKLMLTQDDRIKFISIYHKLRSRK